MCAGNYYYVYWFMFVLVGICRESSSVNIVNCIQFALSVIKCGLAVVVVILESGSGHCQRDRLLFVMCCQFLV